ncbi:uncharacterized protein DUF2752 [Lacinutrix venerupis]|uniref:DUF2752 domain-containing protein n=1 Tax=Lacinutrix venerupis TaxID=1486034 RepID=UPI000EB16733|nr:uncharacterized protein DUF2752 [Lacinutrix venerupis]
MLKKRKQTILFIIIIVLIVSGLLALYFLYNPSHSAFFPKCIFYKTTGLHCPGCGSQRALHDVLQGNFIAGLKHNFLLILLIVVLIYKVALFTLEKFYSKKYNSLLNNPKVLKAILIIIILYWVLRNIPVYPFTILAP